MSRCLIFLNAYNNDDTAEQELRQNGEKDSFVSIVTPSTLIVEERGTSCPRSAMLGGNRHTLLVHMMLDVLDILREKEFDESHPEM